MNKEDILDEQHWKFDDYKQRMETKKWKALLLNDDDRIIFKGRVIQLAAKNLGSGVVEVSKLFPATENTENSAAKSDK